MKTSNLKPNALRSLRDLALLWLCAGAAATVWAVGIPDESDVFEPPIFTLPTDECGN